MTKDKKDKNEKTQGKKRYLMMAVKMAIAFLCVYYFGGHLFRAFNISAYRLEWSAFEMPFYIIAGAFGVYIAAWAVNTYSLVLAARFMGYSVDFKSAWICQGLFIPGVYIPGAVWNPAGRVVLLKKWGVPLSDATMLVGVVHIYTIFGGLAVGLLALKEIFPRWADGNELIVMSIALIAVFALLLHSKSTGMASRVLSRLSGRAVMLGGFSLTQTFVLLLFKVGYFVVQGAGYYILVSFYSKSGGQMGRIIEGYCLASTTGALAFMVPAGLGVKEFVLAMALKGEHMTGVSVIVIVIASRIWTTIGELMLYLSSLFLHIGAGGKGNVGRDIAAPGGAEDF